MSAFGLVVGTVQTGSEGGTIAEYYGEARKCPHRNVSITMTNSAM